MAVRPNIQKHYAASSGISTMPKTFVTRWCLYSKNTASNLSPGRRATSFCPPIQGSSSKPAIGAGPNATWLATPLTSTSRCSASPFTTPCTRSLARSQRPLPSSPYDGSPAKSGRSGSKTVLRSQCGQAAKADGLRCQPGQKPPDHPNPALTMPVWKKARKPPFTTAVRS